MPGTPNQILIDKDLRPAYYDDFHCLMSACQFSCCQGGWHIGFSKNDYETIKRQKGSPDLNERLDHCVRRVRKGSFAGKDYGEFVLQDGACPLWKDGICSLQREKGAAVLPEVCRVFPRSEGYMPSGYFERYLDFGCEGVFSLLWNLPDGVDFISDPLPEKQWHTWKNPEGRPLLPWFQDIRSVCIDILQNRRLALPERIFVMGMALRELAEGEMDIPGWLRKSAALAEGIEPAQFLRHDRTTLSMFLANNVNILYWLSRDTQKGLRDLTEILGLKRESESGKVTLEGGQYLAARKRFEETLGTREWFWENLMVAIFYNWRQPDCNSTELLWRGYVSYCNLYSIYRFFSVMSCREGAAGNRKELFHLLVLISRHLLYSRTALKSLCDRFFETNSATLAHMAILLSG